MSPSHAAISDAFAHDPFFDEVDRIIRRDPGRRGPASYQRDGQIIAPGGLRAACESLARESLGSDRRAIGIVTGFYVEGPRGPTCETDGPTGALYLARAFMSLGFDVTLIGDALTMRTLEAGCRHLALPPEILLEFPFDADDASHPARRSFAPSDSRRSLEWIDTQLGEGRASHRSQGRWSHLIAIERCGPNYVDQGNCCCNMRGQDITAHTAKTHLLFEAIAAKSLPIVTIGLADGGNEIGMGSVAWETLRDAGTSNHAAKIACRIATDHLIVAGVSDWAAYALAAGVCRLRGRSDLITESSVRQQEALIETLVRDGGAVDGVTRLAEATVDGLPLELYQQALVGIQRACIC